MPTDRIMGIETEFAVSATSKEGVPIDRHAILQRLTALAIERWRFLPATCGNGIFTTSGARFYVDTGGHPEWCAAETPDLREAVAQVKAGENLLNELATALQEQEGGRCEVCLFRSNVSFNDGVPSTWGQHESYMTRALPGSLAQDLIPHLVTRIIYTGAGGFSPFSPNRLAFCLSPRALFFSKAISDDSIGYGRGIFHTRDESLAGPGYWRLHVICGESLHSETALYLKLGATSLVVAMAEAGLEPGRKVQLQDPVQALHRVSGDLQHPLSLADGRTITALDLQAHYLEIAERHQNHECMPSFAPQVCETWRRTLDGLRAGPEKLARVLDWPFKAQLFEKLHKDSGIHAVPLFIANGIEHRLYEALEGTSYVHHLPDLKFLIGPGSPVLETAAMLSAELRRTGMTWNDLQTPDSIRHKLLEVDLRLAQIGPRGLYQQLDQTGMLEHRILAPSEIETAMTEPPASGRAAIRGKAVQKLHDRPGVTCSWQAVGDPENRRYLDLSDPFCAAERWVSRGGKMESDSRDHFESIMEELAAGRQPHGV